ncbi:MAG: Gfo/Idh/MocA family oxidoreductase [Prolixibacteraceae bacterium]|nr:Gfo/Idh/MocA family oxidoreductase [Prolixibacteraceae bacterium]
MKKQFALIGSAGYIAERHMQAIRAVDGELVAIADKNDVMGKIDSYFPGADFFLETERFDRYLDKQRRNQQAIDYVSICTPNYLHDAHIRLALRNQAHAICEKPLVLNPWNIDALEQIEKESGKQIYNILQLRLHPTIIALREKVLKAPADKIFDVDLTYITSRGKWYYYSWKGDVSKSGGITTNIGIHFFDMLTWIFGDAEFSKVHFQNAQKAGGFLQLQHARVRWFLSLDQNDLPREQRSKGLSTYRSITIDGEEIEFSSGFTDLHTQSYQQILSGHGFGIDDARTSVELAYQIRNSEPAGLTGDYHPFLNL